MYAVIFEVQPKTELAAQDYFDLAAELRTELEEIDGFISVRTFLKPLRRRKISLHFLLEGRESLEAVA